MRIFNHEIIIIPRERYLRLIEELHNNYNHPILGGDAEEACGLALDLLDPQEKNRPIEEPNEKES